MPLPNSLTTASNRRDASTAPVERRFLGCLPGLLLLALLPLAGVLAIPWSALASIRIDLLTLAFLVTTAPVGFVPHLAPLGLPDHWTVVVSCTLFSGYLFFGVLPLVVRRKAFSLLSCGIILMLFILNTTGCREVITRWQPGGESYEDLRQIRP